MDNAYGIPTCLAFIWSEDYPVTFGGSGCHTDPHIALARAITEAAQSRLTCIAGTRDDLLDDSAAFATRPHRPPVADAIGSWGELVAGYDSWRGTFADQVTSVAGRIEGVTGFEPICIDLSSPSAVIAAVKVLCPGTRSRMRRSIPR